MAKQLTSYILNISNFLGINLNTGQPTENKTPINFTEGFTGHKMSGPSEIDIQEILGNETKIPSMESNSGANTFSGNTLRQRQVGKDKNS